MILLAIGGSMEKKMAYRGGIDKRAIAKGGQVMKREVMRVVPPLLKEGGFIPKCDHGVPPDISWPNYIEYSHLLARLTGWLLKVYELGSIWPKLKNDEANHP